MMNEKELFVFGNLEKKSNAITAFIILQSLLLADRFSERAFRLAVKEYESLWNIILYGHAILILFSVLFLMLINKKNSKNIGDLKKEIFLTQSTVVKIYLIIFFGIIPVFVLLSP
ncbi:hypothetical protein [uncultured Aquimarina sp.]|uniref:hypothetical protein n=1 Tax=uncultured Aquimarina sp. TaxID=575652 RepID=UPI0026267AE4|nr:hypothetical protein [uncultured Aquimarina sp.]